MRILNILNHLCFLLLMAFAIIWAPLRAGMNLAAADMALWLDQGLAHYQDLGLTYSLWFLPMVVARSLSNNLSVLYVVYALCPLIWSYALYVYFSFRWKRPQAGVLLLLPLLTATHLFFDAGHPALPMLTAFAATIFLGQLLWTHYAVFGRSGRIRVGLGLIFSLAQAIALACQWPDYVYPDYMHDSRFYFQDIFDYLTHVDPSQYLLLLAIAAYVTCLSLIRRTWKPSLVLVFLVLLMVLLGGGLRPAYVQEFEARLLPISFCVAVLAYIQWPLWSPNTKIGLSWMILFFVAVLPVRSLEWFQRSRQYIDNLIHHLPNSEQAHVSLWHRVYHIDAAIDPLRLSAQSYLMTTEQGMPPCYLSISERREQADIVERVRPYRLHLETYCSAETYRRDFGLPFLWDDTGQSFLFGNVETQQSKAARTGSYGVYLDSNYVYGFTLDILDFKRGDSLYLSVYRRGHERAHMIVAAENSNLLYVKEQRLGEVNPQGWQCLESTFVLDRSYSRLRFYVWNAEPQEPVSFDDFTLKIFRD